MNFFAAIFPTSMRDAQGDVQLPAAFVIAFGAFLLFLILSIPKLIYRRHRKRQREYE